MPSTKYPDIPIKADTVVADIEEGKRIQDTQTFLKLAALGDKDIRTGRTRPVEEFAASMRLKLATRKHSVR